jgi:hypothetical protein
MKQVDVDGRFLTTAAPVSRRFPSFWSASLCVHLMPDFSLWSHGIIPLVEGVFNKSAVDLLAYTQQLSI